MLYIVFALFVLTGFVSAKKGECFVFTGTEYLKYDFGNIDITHSAWYKLSFKTVQEDGIILFAEGSHDYEALFIRDGKLNYFLFNPTPYGGGGSFGGSFKSDAKVNNDTWITVEIFRNRIPKQKAKESLTGMIISTVDGSKEKHIESGERVGVQIVLPIYIAATNEYQGEGGEHFVGQIKDMKEKRSGTMLGENIFNSGAARCLGEREPM